MTSHGNKRMERKDVKVCVLVCACSCIAHMCDWRPKDNVVYFLDYSPHYCTVRVLFSTLLYGESLLGNLKFPDLALLSDQLNPEDPPVSTSPQH